MVDRRTMLGGESRRLPPGLADAVDRRVSIAGETQKFKISHPKFNYFKYVGPYESYCGLNQCSRCCPEHTAPSSPFKLACARDGDPTTAHGRFHPQAPIAVPVQAKGP